jgi:hypothetical protein
LLHIFFNFTSIKEYLKPGSEELTVLITNRVSLARKAVNEIREAVFVKFFMNKRNSGKRDD